ncbi:MAG: hypothetical protein HDS81_07530 [Bacteroidales bacterium]|nr:hypothetical protein [Bacteroidales bacterium]MBD5344987.1 hypothetical protein [Bacteroides sp.]
MKKDMIFFDTDGKGLTSTSANHIANLAKEMISEIETTLNEMTLYSTSVTLISGKEPNILNHGADDKEVERVPELLRLIAESKSLIAWLREAIKAKERLLDEASSQSLEEYAREQGIELEEAPMRGHTLTEDEYFAGKSADERCRYYSLEALAATLGKAIHPGGEFADARKQLQAKAKKPHEVEGKGRDTLIYTYRPTVDQQVVEDVYFSIQARYRDVQSRLNAMKHECKKAIEESAINESTRYSRELSEWTANMQLIQARHAEHINKRSRYIASLRILIPESLRRIYDTVSQLGKNN